MENTIENTRKWLKDSGYNGVLQQLSSPKAMFEYADEIVKNCIKPDVTNRVCEGCGKPLSDYCEHCNHLWQT